MMYFSELDNTCSMLEMVYLDIVEDLENFDDQLIVFTCNEPPLDYGVKCIIYNCKCRSLEPELKALGFKKVNSYTGNEHDYLGRNVKINVWMLNITKTINNRIAKTINKYKKQVANYTTIK